MKILQINTVYSKGSTGKIAFEIHDLCLKEKIECVTAYRYEENIKYVDTVTISTWLDCHIHNRISRYTMLQGFFSFFQTRKFLKWVREYDPDIIHLHNIHGSYINHGLLFNFIKEKQINVVWTLHDCWAFTGGCAYFDIIKCEKWKTECRNCPQKIKSTWMPDISNMLYNKKKKLFKDVALTIVTPSRWLESIVKQSFLSDYPVNVIHNGINLDIFKPTEGDFRKKYQIENKFIVLGVAFGWGKRKGLDVFIELSKRLNDRYQIILVGTDDTVDKQLPINIISIHRTQNQIELAEIYTAADVFVNPTREETFGLVNIEALACGTPGVTFCTGGSPECFDESCGKVVEKNDVDSLEREIRRICELKMYNSKSCIEFAEKFDQKDRHREYISLYKRICNE